jgi:hypothetical protein
MNKKIKQKFSRNKILVSLVLIIFFVQIITASGVSRPYWDDHPLKLAPGESKTIQLTLQNTDDEDMTFKTTINSEIAELDDKSDEYLVPSGKTDQKVNVKIEIPKNAEIGTEYKVRFTFKEIASGEGGMISMTSAFSMDVPVEVVSYDESALRSEKTQEKEFGWNYIIIGVIAVLILIGIINNIKKRKK